MLSPCEWAKDAFDKKDCEFTLKLLPDGPMTRAKLVEVENSDVESFDQYRFILHGSIDGPTEDGKYMVDGAGVHETEICLNVNIHDLTVEYQACITCGYGKQS
jgi:hypothetical protein